MVYKLPGILAPVCPSHMPSLCVPPAEKWSGWQSWISWAYYPKLVKDQWDCKISEKNCLSPFKYLYFFWAGFPQNAFIVAKLHCCKCPRNLTWFTGPFLLMRGWEFIHNKVLLSFNPSCHIPCMWDYVPGFSPSMPCRWGISLPLLGAFSLASPVANV